QITSSNVLSSSSFLSGGGIYSLGTLNVNNSYFAHNELRSNSSADGAAIWASGNTHIDGSTIYSNTAPYGYGGGIYSQGTLSITNSTVSSNLAGKGGAGIQTYLGTTTLQTV